MALSTPAHWHDLGEGAEAGARPVSRAPTGAALLPDLATLAGLLTFFYVLFFYQGYTRLFRDSDAGWHLRSGESILATGTLPRQDPYSFTKAGQPWMNWEWLADVAAALAHRAGGIAAVAVLYSAAIAIAVWVWFRLQWRLGTNFLLAAALAIPLLGTLNLHWLARPHIWSWVFLLAALLLLESRRVAPFVVLAALWANVHGSFFLAPLLALFYRAPRTAALAALATLVNPYGWNLHRHVWSYLTDTALLGSVGEFQSFNFHVSGSGQIIVALGIAAAGTTLALYRGRLDHFLVGVLLLAGAIRSARGLPLVALAILPIAGAHLRIPEVFRRWLEPVRDYGDRLRIFDCQAGAWKFAPLLVMAAVLSVPAVGRRAGFPTSEFPVAAAERLESLGPEVRLLAPDKFGGYLIYRFEGRRRVFFDGRSDFYGSEFLEEWRRLAQVRPGWHDILVKHRFTHAVLPNDYSLVDALQRAGWTVIYGDSTATLLRGAP
jgi:hypothetical protein